MAVAYAALGNGGTVLTPHTSPTMSRASPGRVLEEVRPAARRHIDIAQSTRDTIMTGLTRAATEPGGTSYPVFGNFPFAVAGKTGTAQRPEPAGPVLVHRPRAREEPPDRRCRDARAGRLRRRHRSASGRADPGALLPPADHAHGDRGRGRKRPYAGVMAAGSQVTTTLWGVFLPVRGGTTNDGSCTSHAHTQADSRSRAPRRGLFRRLAIRRRGRPGRVQRLHPRHCDARTPSRASRSFRDAADAVRADRHRADARRGEGRLLAIPRDPGRHLLTDDRLHLPRPRLRSRRARLPPLDRASLLPLPALGARQAAAHRRPRGVRDRAHPPRHPVAPDLPHPGSRPGPGRTRLPATRPRHGHRAGGRHHSQFFSSPGCRGGTSR